MENPCAVTCENRCILLIVMNLKDIKKKNNSRSSRITFKIITQKASALYNHIFAIISAIEISYGMYRNRQMENIPWEFSAQLFKNEKIFMLLTWCGYIIKVIDILLSALV